ncbi:MAG TPA: cupredoxin domain-containing protein [Nitrososphaeraceae archaeon]
MTTVIGMNNLLLIPAARAQSTNANITTTSSSTNQTSFASLSNTTFYLFTAEHEGLNEEKLGIPEDAYSPTTFVVNEGDNVTIHFYNLDTSDRHTFTIGAPYNINLDLLPLHNGTTTFKATQEGVFRFYCTYHQPTMAGQFVVLNLPSVEKIGPATVK